MRWSDAFLRLRALLFRGQMDEELNEELQFHLEMQAAKNRARDVNPSEASRQARLDFGSVDRTAEECREARGINFIETLFADIRYALRGMRRGPMFATTVIAIIAIGLGVNTAIFTIFDAYVLRPLPIRDPSSLYRLHWSDRKGYEHLFSWNQFAELRGDNNQSSFTDMAAMRLLLARPMLGGLVSCNFFDVLGVGVVRGRTLVKADCAAPGSAPVVVLSYQAWQHQFGGDADIVGRKISLRGYPMEVVGVTPPGFTGLERLPFDFWTPMTMTNQMQDGPGMIDDRAPTISIIGRIAPNIDKRAAEAALKPLVQRITTDPAVNDSAGSPTLAPAGTAISLSPEVIAIFSPIIIAFALVLLIACANVANLMLARAMARQREIGTRLSLGASRSRLIRQLLTESVVLAVPASILGFFVAQVSLQYGQRLLFGSMPPYFAQYIRIIPLHADVRVLAFMVSAGVAVAIVFGLAPALQVTRTNVLQACRGEFTTDHRPARLRNLLVVAQVTACVVLLSSSMMLLRSAREISQMETGLNPHGILSILYSEKHVSELLSYLRTNPLVETIVAAQSSPLNGPPHNAITALTANGKSQAARCNLVSPDFFSVLDIPILRGRTFTPEEANAQSPVVLVSSSTATRLWPNRDPIGQIVKIAPDANNPTMRQYDKARVMGVVGDIMTGPLDGAKEMTMLYFPIRDAFALHGLESASAAGSNKYILVKVQGDDLLALQMLDSDLARTIPGAVVQIARLQDMWSVPVYPFRAAGWVAGMLAGLALWLSISGVYGVLSYLVAQRSKEIGIRLALGASSGSVASLVLKQSAKLVLLGVATGTVIAVLFSRFVAFQLKVHPIKGFDGQAYLLAIAVVIFAAALAACVPTRRALSVDPVEILRYE
ncbi:MAG TPA: ADOP family duplicated permease [Terriglobales bacterium]|nr:ADOP family duplicated permease [Terriglobales bacterium]